MDRLTAHTDVLGRVESFVYDAAGNRLREYNPDNPPEHNYNRNGQMTVRRRRKPGSWRREFITDHLEWDVKGQLVSIPLTQEHQVLILMQENPNQVQIRELMILKVIGIRKLTIFQQAITIFTMTKKIEDKLLLLRAKKFADSIEGIDSIFISLLGNDMPLWHRDKLTIANAIDNGNGRICFEQPARMDELIRAVISTLGLEGGFSCWLVYEG